MRFVQSRERARGKAEESNGEDENEETGTPQSKD